jgi:hypothetical protein
MKGAVVAGGALVAIMGCLSITDPSDRVPKGAVAFVAPARFRTMWRTVEACSGQSADFSRIEWFSVPAGFKVDGATVDGYWEDRGWRGRIFLVGGASAVSEIVRHEMLHAVVHSARHERRNFLGGCRGIVTCASPCMREGGVVPVPPTMTAVRAADMTQSVVVIPPVSADSLWYTVILSARSRHADPRRLELLSGGSFATGFAYQAGAASATQTVNAVDLRNLPPIGGGEAVSFAFDVQAAPSERGRSVAVQGYFDLLVGAKATVVIP